MLLFYSSFFPKTDHSLSRSEKNHITRARSSSSYTSCRHFGFPNLSHLCMGFSMPHFWKLIPGTLEDIHTKSIAQGKEFHENLVLTQSCNSSYLDLHSSEFCEFWKAWLQNWKLYAESVNVSKQLTYFLDLMDLREIQKLRQKLQLFLLWLFCDIFCFWSSWERLCDAHWDAFGPSSLAISTREGALGFLWGDSRHPCPTTPGNVLGSTGLCGLQKLGPTSLISTRPFILIKRGGSLQYSGFRDCARQPRILTLLLKETYICSFCMGRGIRDEFNVVQGVHFLLSHGRITHISKRTTPTQAEKLRWKERAKKKKENTKTPNAPLVKSIIHFIVRKIKQDIS